MARQALSGPFPAFKDPHGWRAQREFHAIYIPAKRWVGDMMTPGEQVRATTILACEVREGTYGVPCPEGWGRLSKLSIPAMVSILGDLRTQIAVLHAQASPAWYRLAIAKVLHVVLAVSSKGAWDERTSVTRIAVLTLLQLLTRHNTALASRLLLTSMNAELVSLEEAAMAAVELADRGEPSSKDILARLVHVTPLPADIRELAVAWSQSTQRPAALHTHQMVVLDQQGESLHYSPLSDQPLLQAGELTTAPASGGRPRTAVSGTQRWPGNPDPPLITISHNVLFQDIQKHHPQEGVKVSQTSHSTC